MSSETCFLLEFIIWFTGHWVDSTVQGKPLPDFIANLRIEMPSLLGGLAMVDWFQPAWELVELKPSDTSRDPTMVTWL